MGLAALAGFYGAAGVGLAAAAVHLSGGPLVTTAAYFLLFHAAGIASLCAFARTKADHGILVGASLLALGVFLFSGELALHALLGLTAVSMAAPTGGITMIAGWLVAGVAMAAALRGREGSA